MSAALVFAGVMALVITDAWSRRSVFIHRTRPMSDEAFLSELNVAPEDAPVALALRESIADACGVPAMLVRSDVSPRTLHKLMFVGWDRLDIEFRLEARLRVKLRIESDLLYDAVRREPTLAGCIRRLLPDLSRQLAGPARRIFSN